LDVAFKVVAFGHMLMVAKDFALFGIAFGPFPLLQKLLVPGEAISVRVGIAACAWIPVPVPGAADGFGFVVNSHLQPQFIAERLEHIHAGEARADHDSVEVLNWVSHLLPSLNLVI
jgi:hypothetical protein